MSGNNIKINEGGEGEWKIPEQSEIKNLNTLDSVELDFQDDLDPTKKITNADPETVKRGEYFTEARIKRIGGRVLSFYRKAA